MTPEDHAQRVINHMTPFQDKDTMMVTDFLGRHRDWIIEEVRLAVTTEREGCAQVADQVEKEQCGADGLDTARDIAARIRVRSEF